MHTLSVHLSYRRIVMKRWEQCPIASAELKDGEPPQTGLGENFRGGRGGFEKESDGEGLPSLSP